MDLSELGAVARVASESARTARARAREARARALLTTARAHSRYDCVRRRQLSAITRQWEARRRCWDRSGVVVCMADAASEVLRLGLSPAAEGHPAIVWVRGEIDIESSAWLRTVLGAQLSTGTPVIMDLADVTFIDASAVGVLAGASKAARQAGTTFALRHPSRIVARVLDLTGLAALVGEDTTSEEQAPGAGWGRQVVSLRPPPGMRSAPASDRSLPSPNGLRRQG